MHIPQLSDGVITDAALRFTVAVALLLCLSGVRVAVQDAVPRTSGDKPDLSGTWQAIGAHYQDLELLGSIPYTNDARARRDGRDRSREFDPAVRCMPGLPRATYMPYPFQIAQNDEHVLFTYGSMRSSRIVDIDEDADTGARLTDPWMGRSLGSWDGDTLVIDVTEQANDTWLDASGNYHSDSIEVQERYTAISRNQLLYEATITDPDTFTEPWTIRLPLYRQPHEVAQLQESDCVGFVESAALGLRRNEPDPPAGDRTAETVYAPEVGARVTPRGTLEAWESYPAGFSLNRGRKLADIHPGEVYVVVETKTIPSIIRGDNYYLRVRSALQGEHACAREDCWVYQGRERASQPPNLEVQR